MPINKQCLNLFWIIGEVNLCSTDGNYNILHIAMNTYEYTWEFPIWYDLFFELNDHNFLLTAYL